MKSQTVFEQQLDNARQLNEQNRAAEAYTIAHAIVQKLANTAQKPLLSDALTVEGNALRRLKETQKSIVILQKALDLRQKIYGKNRIEYANACQNLANAYIEATFFDKALPLLKETRRIRRNNMPPTHPDVIKIYAPLGLVWNKLKAFDSTCQLLAVFPSDAPPQYAVPFYLQIGAAFSAKQNRTSALFYYERALSLSTHLPDQAAMCLQNMGLCFVEQGQPAEAEIYFQKAHSLLKINSLADTEAFADLYQNWATCARRLGQYPRAFDFLTKAFSRYETLSNPIKSAGVALNLGIWATEQRTFEAAHYYFEKAETLAQKSGRADNAFLANLYLQQTYSYLEQKKYTAARIAINKAQGIKISENSLISEIYIAATEVAIGEKRFGDAKTVFQKAQSTVATTGLSADPVVYLRLLATAAILSKKEGDAAHFVVPSKDLKANLVRYDAAIQFLENIVATHDAQASVWFWQKQYGFLFDDAIALCYDISQKQTDKESVAYWQEKIGYYVEKSKNVWLHHLQQKQGARVAVPDSLQERAAQLLLKINILETNRQLLQQKRPLSKNQLPVLEAQLFELKQQQKQLDTVLKKWAMPIAAQVLPTMTRLQNALLLHQAVLYYHVSESVIWILILTKENRTIRKVEKTDKWATQVSDYYNLLRNNTTITPQLAELSYFFHQKLIEPATPFLTRKTELTIIPDNELSYLPFEAFYTEGGQNKKNAWDAPYLLRRFAIHYAYDWSSLLRKTVPADNQNRRTPLVIAPYFQNNINGLHALTFNNEEGQRIHNKIGGVFLQKEAATEAAFLSHLDQSSIIHLATHGIVNIDNPNLSGVAFTDVVDSVENEMLFVQEIYGLHLQTDLIVLSACETNIGQILSGEGVLSIARAFTYSGVHSLVTSLWSIDDQTTAGLMVRFYENLEKGMTKSEALRQAKLDFINSNRAQAHPFYWAALTVLGDDTPLQFRAERQWWIPLSILGVLSFMGLVYWRKRFKSFYSK